MIPNSPVFLVRNSLNSYKTGDNKQKLCPSQQEHTALSHHVVSQQPGRAAAAGCGWQCSVQAQAARLAMCDGFTALRGYLWPEPQAGEHLTEMLHGSAVAQGMVDAPRLRLDIKFYLWSPLGPFLECVRNLCTY